MSRVTCPNCGRQSATARELPSYHYRQSGLPNVWLSGGVTETVCGRCGKAYVRVAKEGQLLQVIALRLLGKPGPLTGREMRFLRASCGMTQVDLAQVTKHRRATVAEREARANPKLTLAEELWLRLIFLKSFREHLESEGNNFLAAQHMERLNAFTEKLCREVVEFAERMARRSRQEIRTELSTEGAFWSLDEAA